jgi:CRISPR-associated protein Cas2
MVVLIVSAVKPGLRGELSRWMIEPHAGVFVGHISLRVREMLWEKVIEEVGTGSAVLIASCKNEQGFSVLAHGDRSRLPIDYDGLTLIAQTTK